MVGQCCLRNSGNSWTVIPSTPGLPLLALIRANACLQFSRSQTSSINCSPIARLSVPRFAASDSVPSADTLGASLLLSSVKANSSWFFCRPVRIDCSTLSPEPRTNGRSPEVSSTAFRTQPPDLQPVPLMDMDFVGASPLVRHPYASNLVLVHRLVRLLHASFRPRLATTPLRFAITSPPSGCEKDFHLRAVEHARHTRHRGGGHPPTPATPPCVRVRTRRFELVTPTLPQTMTEARAI